MIKVPLAKTEKNIACVAGALAIAAAVGMDLQVNRKLLPDAHEIFGFFYQLIGRLAVSLPQNRIYAAMACVLSFLLLRRYLFHKPDGTGVGEYLLSTGMALMTLMAESVVQTDTIASLWANGFQLVKAMLVLLGWSLLYLCALRALREGVDRAGKRSDSRIIRFWNRHPLLFPFVVILLCWLPHIISKYPGVMDVDTIVMIRCYMTRTGTDHFPPFCTWLFGRLCEAGQAVGCQNLFYFLFMIVQCILCIFVLAGTMCSMKRSAMPQGMQWAILAVYAAAPCYVGWEVVIGKDSLYLPFFLLFTHMFLESMIAWETFRNRKSNWIFLGLSAFMMGLSRPNGTIVACASTVILAIVFLFRKQRGYAAGVLTAMVLMCGAVSVCNEWIVDSIPLGEARKQDAFSIVFQSTATIAMEHGEAIPEEEIEIVDRVMDYGRIPEYYRGDSVWVKDLMRASFREQGMELWGPYLQVWLRQIARYPVSFIDSVLRISWELLTPVHAEAEYYYSITNPQLTDGAVYKMSTADMRYYETASMVPFDNAQRLLTEWYHDFGEIPVIGDLTNLAACFYLLVMALYVSFSRGQRLAVLAMIPVIVSALFGFISPSVQLRLQLPLVCAVPLILLVLWMQQPKSLPYRPVEEAEEYTI